MLESLGFWVRLRYASWSWSAAGPRMISVSAQISAWNVAEGAFAPVVTRLLNCVFTVDRMQSWKELILELIRLGSLISG